MTRLWSGIAHWLAIRAPNTNPIRDGLALVFGAILATNLLTGPSAMVQVIEHIIGHPLTGWQICGAGFGLFLGVITSMGSFHLYRGGQHPRFMQASHILRACIAWPLIWQALLPAIWATVALTALMIRKVMNDGATTAAILVLLAVGIATLAVMFAAHMALRRSFLRRRRH